MICIPSRASAFAVENKERSRHVGGELASQYQRKARCGGHLPCRRYRPMSAPRQLGVAHALCTRCQGFPDRGRGPPAAGGARRLLILTMGVTLASFPVVIIRVHASKARPSEAEARAALGRWRGTGLSSLLVRLPSQRSGQIAASGLAEERLPKRDALICVS